MHKSKLPIADKIGNEIFFSHQNPLSHIILLRMTLTLESPNGYHKYRQV